MYILFLWLSSTVSNITLFLCLYRLSCDKAVPDRNMSDLNLSTSQSGYRSLG